MSPLRLLAALSLTCLAAAGWSAEPLVKSGESIAFLGDSITQQGAGSPSGYVRLVISGLEANGIKATAIPAGISGHKSNQMLDRLQNDVLAKKPTWMTLSCGVNDVWHGANGVPLVKYKSNITAIVERAQAAGVKVVVLTATMIHEDAGNAENKTLAAYNDFLRELAKEKGCPLADLNADMQAGLAKAGEARKRGKIYTTDGVHMAPAGNQMMALGVLRAFGLDDAALAKAQEAWLDIPRAVPVNSALSFRQFEQLQALAAKRGRSINDLIEEMVAAELAKKP